MTRRLLSCITLAAFLVFAVDCAAQRSGETIRTYVLTGALRFADSHRAAEMIKVDLKKFTGETVSTAFTRSNGDFEFVNLARGAYYLIVEEEGFEPLREAVEIINTDRRGVVLYLSKPFTIVSRIPSGPVSARDLSLPRKAREPFLKGREMLIEKQDSRGSMEYFRRAIAELPTYYEAYHLLGVALQQTGRVDDAERSFEQSIALSEGRYASAYVSLASLLCDQKRFTEAEKFARRSVELDPQDWMAHFNLARTLLGLNQLDEAEKSLSEVNARRPEFAGLHLVYANLCIRRKDYPTLLKHLDQYLRLEPNSAMSATARELRDRVRREMAQAGPAPAKP